DGVDDDAGMSSPGSRTTPIYPATEWLSQRALRGITYRILQPLDNERLETLLPAALDGGDGTIAIRTIHFPEDWESLSAAREHLVLSEFFAMQMLIAARRAESSVRAGAAHCGRGELLEKFLRSLPFELTYAQQKRIAEIRQNF